VSIVDEVVSIADEVVSIADEVVSIADEVVSIADEVVLATVCICHARHFSQSFLSLKVKESRVECDIIPTAR
jgi:hypothetical protein